MIHALQAVRNEKTGGIVKITICLPFRRVTRQKTFQNFYKPQGYSVLEAVSFETAKTNTIPSPGPDDLKQVATKNKNHLKKRNLSKYLIKNRSGRGRMKKFLFCSFMSVSFGWHLHLEQIWPCFSRFEWFGICFSDEENENTVTAGFVRFVFFRVMCLCY